MTSDFVGVRMSHITLCELRRESDAIRYVSHVPPKSYYGQTEQLHGLSIFTDERIPPHTVRFETSDSYAQTFDFGWQRPARVA